MTRPPIIIGMSGSVCVVGFALGVVVALIALWWCGRLHESFDAADSAAAAALLQFHLNADPMDSVTILKGRHEDFSGRRVTPELAAQYK